MAVVVALQVFKDTGIGHECVSLVRNRHNQVQCLFPKPINFQAEKNSSCPTFETGLRGVVAPTARKERPPGWMAHRKYVRMLPSSWFNNSRSDLFRFKEAAMVALERSPSTPINATTRQVPTAPHAAGHGHR